MKILVISDSHGDTTLLNQIVSKHRGSVELVVFLGDNLLDANEVMRDFPTIAYLGVLGNCDFPSMYTDARTDGNFKIENKRIFYTHGHRYNVNFGLEYLVANAKFNNCDIALFGHTHVALTEMINGVFVINPGSISRPRDGSNGTYALLEVTSSDVKCDIMEVEK